MTDDLEKRRLYAKFEKQPNGCWEWTAGLRGKGYGQFWFRGRSEQAHRASWILHGNPDLGDRMLLHKCDNKKCVNPDHLYPGTNSDNLKDACAAGRFKILNADEVCEIRRRLRRGDKKMQIAEDYGMFYWNLWRIQQGYTWAWLKTN